MGSPSSLDSTSGRISQRRRVLIIYNPKAGRLAAGRFARVVRRLAASGATVTVMETRRPGDAEAFAAGVAAEEFEVVAAAGGDGTINEVVNGLDGKEVPMAVIPLGTANVLAEEIGLKPGAEAVVRTILRGADRPVHVGVVNGRRFVMMAGVGFDAHVVAGVGPTIKRVLGKGAYVLESLLAIFRFSYPAYRVTVDGEGFCAASVIIANGRHYGGRFVCAPRASLSDASFEVCLFRRTGPWNVIRYGLGLCSGRLHRLADVEVVTGSRVTVEGNAGEPVQCDGENGLRLPLIAAAGKLTMRLVMPCPADGPGAG